MPVTGLPAGAWVSWPLHPRGAGAAAASLAGIRADSAAPGGLPGHLFQGVQWLASPEVAPEGAVCLTVAGAAQAAPAFREGTPPLLLPVELRHVNRAASTNAADSTKT